MSECDRLKPSEIGAPGWLTAEVAAVLIGGWAGAGWESGGGEEDGAVWWQGGDSVCGGGKLCSR